MLHRPTIALLVCAAFPTAASAESLTPDPNKWRPVVYSDLQVPGPASQSYAALWADHLKRNNDAYAKKGDRRWTIANAPAAESHVVIRSPDKVLVFSVLHTVTGCTIIRRGPVANATLKRCPMRIALYRQGSSSVAEAGKGCFIEYGSPPGGGQPDLVRNISMAAYDAETKTVRAGIIFQGDLANECQYRVPLTSSSN